MLEPKVIELARTLVQVEFEERRQQLSREIERVGNDMAERGIGRSGIFVTCFYHVLHSIKLGI